MYSTHIDRLKDASLSATSSLLNTFIRIVKNEAMPKASAKAKAKAKARNYPREEPKHSTLEEALAAAHACNKCEPTKMGTKGCTACMGEWFESIRIKRAPPKFLKAIEGTDVD